MYVTGNWARIDRGIDSVSVVPEHWKPARGDSSVLIHIPTGNRYQVSVGDELSEETKATIFNLRARLYWIPEGGIVPEAAAEIEFGKAAIAIFMVRRGLWKPEIQDSPFRPGHNSTKNLVRGMHR
jgi:hypothetical protein